MEISSRHFGRVSCRRHVKCCNWTLTTPSTVKVLWRSCEGLVVFLDSELWSNKSVNITWNMDRHEWKSSERLKVPASFPLARSRFVKVSPASQHVDARREVTCWAFDIEMRSMAWPALSDFPWFQVSLGCCPKEPKSFGVFIVNEA